MDHHISPRFDLYGKIEVNCRKSSITIICIRVSHNVCTFLYISTTNSSQFMAAALWYGQYQWTLVALRTLKIYYGSVWC